MRSELTEGGGGLDHAGWTMGGRGGGWTKGTNFVKPFLAEYLVAICHNDLHDERDQAYFCFGSDQGELA